MNHKVDFYIIEKIKAELARKMGYVITTKSDCKKLSEIILSQGFGYVSESTLYRLLLHPTNKNYYKSTIDIISLFLGFNNSASFIESLNRVKYFTNFNGINPLPESNKTLLFYNIEDRNFQTLQVFFENLEECSTEIKEASGLALFDALTVTKNSAIFFEQFAQNKFVRNYLMEQLHDPKFRINNYDYAYKLYLKGLNYESNIGEFQDYIFGLSVLFRSYYLNKDFTAASEIGKRLYKQASFIEAYDSSLHIFPFIRYKSYRLLYLNLTDENLVSQFDYANQLLELCQSLKSNLNSMEQKIVYHTIAESMLNNNLPDIFHKKLKHIFKDNFKTIPESIFHKHIKFSMPYFEANGLLYHRP